MGKEVIKRILHDMLKSCSYYEKKKQTNSKVNNILKIHIFSMNKMEQ